jgi:hypothetical protein
VAESLVSALEGKISGARVLLARAAVARDVLPDALRAGGAQVDVVDAYQNRVPVEASDQLRQALAEGLDAATFTSSSSVTHLMAAATAAGLAWPFPGVVAVSIGPITSKTLREEGWAPAAEASVSDIPGLVKTVAEYFAAGWVSSTTKPSAGPAASWMLLPDLLAEWQSAFLAIQHVAHRLSTRRSGLGIAAERIGPCDSRPSRFRLAAGGTTIRKSRLAGPQLKLVPTRNTHFNRKSHNQLF